MLLAVTLVVYFASLPNQHQHATQCLIILVATLNVDKPSGHCTFFDSSELSCASLDTSRAPLFRSWVALAMTLGTETRVALVLSGPRYTHTYTHVTYISLLCCMCIISLTRDKAGFEPLNGGDSWRPRRVKTLKRGRRCGDVPHPY